MGLWQNQGMWTDTHLHLDATEYDLDRAQVVLRAQANHVNRFVLPAVHAQNFSVVQQLAKQTPGAVYCLGIHPLYVAQAQESELLLLREVVEQAMSDPLFAGIGEIGLDGFMPDPDWARQTMFFHEQLKIARDFDLPVVMHVRRAQDMILKGLRIYKPKSGIAHAFNGSNQQADLFIQLNMCLGFGGASTYTRALQIRRLVSQLPDHALVLETDGPDIPPEWINHQRNEPCQIPKIADCIAQLRGMPVEQLSRISQSNAERALPALQHTGIKV